MIQNLSSNIVQSKRRVSSHKSQTVSKYKSPAREQDKGDCILVAKNGFSWLNSVTKNSHPSSNVTTKLVHPSENSANPSPSNLSQDLQNVEETKNSTATKTCERLPMRRLLENEVELDDLPQGITVADLKIRFPDLQDVEWGKNQSKVILKFKTAQDTEIAIENGDLPLIGDRVLSWTKAAYFTRRFRRSTSCKIGWNPDATDEDKNYSNISNLFTSKIYVTGLPMPITEDKLLTIFPGALAIDIEHWKRGKMATIEFDTSILAAKACYLAKQKKNLFGKKFHVSPRKPLGYKKYKELVNIEKMNKAMRPLRVSFR